MKIYREGPPPIWGAQSENVVGVLQYDWLAMQLKGGAGGMCDFKLLVVGVELPLSDRLLDGNVIGDADVVGYESVKCNE